MTGDGDGELDSFPSLSSLGDFVEEAEPLELSTTSKMVKHLMR